MSLAVPGQRFAWAGLILLCLGAAACDQPGAVQVPFDSQELRGLFWSPPRPLAPAALLLQTSELDGEDWLRLGGRLRQEGYAVLVLDLAELESREPEGLLAGVGAGFQFLREQKKVDAARIGLVGVRHGAHAALHFVAAEPLARLAVLVSPGWEEPGSAAEAAVRDYGVRPLLLIAPEADTAGASALGRWAAAAQGEAVIRLYSGAASGEDRLSLSQPPAAEEILAFLKSRL